ncbi:hypothetical protein BU17DRAFT_68628 [Hysterangium stoloniferum]|nr:hypothetical protein BU17DRAFT_68628 [Hysterangium stoloniferum]
MSISTNLVDKSLTRFCLRANLYVEALQQTASVDRVQDPVDEAYDPLTFSRPCVGLDKTQWVNERASGTLSTMSRGCNCDGTVGNFLVRPSWYSVWQGLDFGNGLELVNIPYRRRRRRIFSHAAPWWQAMLPFLWNSMPGCLDASDTISRLAQDLGSGDRESWHLFRPTGLIMLFGFFRYFYQTVPPISPHTSTAPHANIMSMD